MPWDFLITWQKNVALWEAVQASKDKKGKSDMEDDIFRIIVPLDDTYLYDFGAVERESADKMPVSADKYSNEGLSKQKTLIVDYLQKNKKITTSKAEEVLGVKQRRGREILIWRKRKWNEW